MREAVIIGAGPCGISTAIELKKVGIDALILEKGCLVNSIYHYPLSMTFFSSPDKIELGGIPLITVQDKPTREEALKYYRALTKIFGIEINTYERVTNIEKTVDGFTVTSENRLGRQAYATRNVIIATGYYDNPNVMNIPGENLPHVFHYFRDAHPYADRKALVIGGRNSAIDTALELQLAGADVTMVYRQKDFHPSVKSWVRPLIDAAVEKGRVKMIWEGNIKEITEQEVMVEQNGTMIRVPADVVFAMTGYRPNLDFLEKLGAKINQDTYVPILNEYMESSIPGLYLAGVVASGVDSTKIFIENGRYHGEKIATHILHTAKRNIG